MKLFLLIAIVAALVLVVLAMLRSGARITTIEGHRETDGPENDDA